MNPDSDNGLKQMPQSFVQAMSTDVTQSKNIKSVSPKLRFKEFRDNWMIHTLEEVTDTFKSGESITSKDIFDFGEYPVYGGNGLRGYTNSFTHDGFYVLIGRQGALCGNINRVKGKNYISEHAIAVQSNSLSDTEWLAQKLDVMKLNKLSESSAQPGLAVGKLLKLKYYFPSLPEQQKIASFLSAVDEKIQQLTRKKELLEQYKKGVMQQLFSGKLRFKDENGKAYLKWEEKRLEEIADVYDGTHQTPKYVVQGIPFYSVEHVTANDFSNTKFISEDVFEKENLRVKLEKGDILMTRIGDIGTAKLIDWEVKASFYVSLALIKIKAGLSAEFISQYIHSRNFQRELWQRTIHVAFPKKINLGEIGNCHLLIPSKEEQQKIASFLSALDLKIESISNQISQTQTFKKGLLQQMFV